MADANLLCLKEITRMEELELKRYEITIITAQ